MAKVERNIVRNYNLQLNEKEYYAILCLVGNTCYTDFRDKVNERYSIRLGRDTPEDFEIIEYDEYSKLYAHLDDNK